MREYKQDEDTNPRQVSVIIGNDLIEKIGLVTVDHVHHQVTFSNPEKKVKHTFSLDPNDDQVIIRSREAVFVIGGPKGTPPLLK